MHDWHLGRLTSPEAGNDRRFPLQRFVTVDWNTPVSNRLLIEASGIHRVERWGGMEPQVGKLGNIDHLTPGMISVSDTLNPVTGGPLSYRAINGTYNNSWNWNIHYRAAVSYITGSNTFKVGFNNAFLHHENTTYSSPAAPYGYNFTSMVPTAITYRLVPRTVKVDVNRDMGIFAQDKWTTGRWTLSGAIRLDSFKNSFPEQSIVGHVLRAESEHPVRQDRQPQLEGRHAQTRGDLRRLRQRQDGVQGHAQQVPRRARDNRVRSRADVGCTQSHQSALEHGIARLDRQRRLHPAMRPEQLRGQRRVPGGGQPQLRHRPAGNDLRSGFDDGLGQTGEQLGVHHQRPAGNHSQDVARGAGTRDGGTATSASWTISAASPADYTPFTFTAPSDPRLPNGGGYTLTGMGLSPTAAPQSYFVTLANNYGKDTSTSTG